METLASTVMGPTIAYLKNPYFFNSNGKQQKIKPASRCI